MIKIAFGSVPKDGGTYTFYRNMRPALLEHGIDLRCVAIGKAQAELWEDAYVNEGCVLLASHARNIKKQAQAFADWCESEQIDIVLGINSEAILSALPHLPQCIRCMSRCANSFDHGYRITLSGYERLAAIIAQTPRQLKDLTTTYRVDPEKITVIPNGIDPEPFERGAEGRGQRSEIGSWKTEAGRRAQAGDEASLHQNAELRTPTSERRPLTTAPPLRLGFLGRLEHTQKGVLFIPDIVCELEKLGVDYTLNIAGKGRHEPELRAALKTQTSDLRPPASKINFAGPLPPCKIPAFLAETDVLIFPSQFEGCPNVLLEAMMSGCVPVSWRLEGITDFIIEDEVNGGVVPLGECAEFAAKVAHYASDRLALRAASKSATTETRKRFATEVAAKNYADLFKKVIDAPAPEWAPLPWSGFEGDPNFEHSWRDWIPKSWKLVLKKLLKT